jgi:sugar phosphate isomerase/epimerase
MTERKLGITAFFGYDISLRERLHMIKEAGFNATFLELSDKEEFVASGQRDLIPSLVRDAGLFFDNIHAPFTHVDRLWSETKSERNMIFRELSDYMAFCYKHQITKMVMHIRNIEPYQTPAYEDMKNGLNIFRDTLSVAEYYNVTIALENLCFSGNAYNKYIFSNIDSPNLKFCFDSSHDNIAKYKAPDHVTDMKWFKYITTTHLSDNFGENDDHFIPLKEKQAKSINWTELMNKIPNSYIGCLLLELKKGKDDPSKPPTAEDFLTTAYSRLADLAKRLE